MMFMPLLPTESSAAQSPQRRFQLFLFFGFCCLVVVLKTKAFDPKEIPVGGQSGSARGDLSWLQDKIQKKQNPSDELDEINGDDELRRTHKLNTDTWASNCITQGGQAASYDQDIVTFRDCVLEKFPSYLIHSNEERKGIATLVYNNCYRTYERRHVVHEKYWSELHRASMKYKGLFETPQGGIPLWTPRFQDQELEENILDETVARNDHEESYRTNNWLTFKHKEYDVYDKRGWGFRASVRFNDNVRIKKIFELVFSLMKKPQITSERISWFKTFPRYHWDGRDDVVWALGEPENQDNKAIVMKFVTETVALICEHFRPAMDHGLLSTELPAFQWRGVCPYVSVADYFEGESFGMVMSSMFTFQPFLNRNLMLSNYPKPSWDNCLRYYRELYYHQIEPENIPWRNREGYLSHLTYPKSNILEAQQTCMDITLDAWMVCKHPGGSEWTVTQPEQSLKNFDECFDKLATLINKKFRQETDKLSMQKNIEH